MIATHKNNNGVTLTATSTAEHVCLLSEAIHALCLHASNDEACAMAIQCAVVEALNNVILHAYKDLPENDIIVHWHQEGRQLRIDITDFGHSMACLPVAVLPDFEAENGRGWWIISASVDEYYYKVVESIEQQRLYKPTGNSAFSEDIVVKSRCNILTLLKCF